MTIDTYKPERLPSVENTVFDPQTEDAWSDVRDAIMELEHACFPEGGFEESYLQTLFEDPKSIVVLLKVNGEVAGFTCGIPDEENPDSLYIETTEILPKWQNNKFITSLIATLECTAKSRGYDFITRHAAVDNGYAANIAKNYEDRIIETYPKTSEEFGNQQYFKIKL